jgi:O-antigen biosynthesis protein
MRFRERLKRTLPSFVLGPLQSLRQHLAAPPLEEIVLHGYEMSVDPSDIFLELGKRANADLRIILDEMGPVPAGNIIGSRAQRLGIGLGQIEMLPRSAEIPRVEVRSGDIFLSFNWWTALNVQGLIDKQSRHFGQTRKPLLYVIQEYEPFFYQFSSTHMIARQAFASSPPCWGIFNSSELYAYFGAQGHKLERSFVFEPQINNALKGILERAPQKKEKRLFVYGRPAVARNCYPAVEKGVRAWASRYPEFSEWEIVSAGLSHSPLELGQGRVMKSAGKLAMEQYGELLLTSAAGLSLMSSPHPSYPPLEMSHFGLWTVTNNYTNKDLTLSHENIISIDNIAPDTIADALARACRNFESDPESGWRGKSLRPSFLDTRPFQFLDELVADLSAQAWQ